VIVVNALYPQLACTSAAVGGPAWVEVRVKAPVPESRLTTSRAAPFAVGA